MGEEAVDILVIEDNPNHAELTLRALAKSGIPARVRVIDDSVAALDYLLGASNGEQATPRVILLDLNLPKVSGIEVLRRLRADSATRTIPVVILSTSLEARDLRECYRLGANSYLHKPADYAEYAATLRGMAAYWVGLNQLPR